MNSLRRFNIWRKQPYHNIITNGELIFAMLELVVVGFIVGAIL